MQYQGGKFRIVDDLLRVMLPLRKPGQVWVEPFVGGANVIAKVPGKRIGADIHKPLIAMWQAVQRGWLPPKVVSRELYNRVRAQQAKFPLELIAAVGFGTSFARKYWGGYLESDKRTRTRMPYAAQFRKNIEAQVPGVSCVKFLCSDYRALKLPKNSFVYCDPPYNGVLGYSKTKFDNEEFWAWCTTQVRSGHVVFVSEYTAPEGWCAVWQRMQTVGVGNNNQGSSVRRVEKLFQFGE